MSTYGAMQDRIQDELKRSDLSAQIRLAIQSSIKHFETTRFWFNTNRATRDTSASQEYYGLPTDYISIDTITASKDNTRWELEEETFNEIERMASNPAWVGSPARYAVFQEQLRLNPIPNGIYSLRISYHRSLTAVSATTDTSAWFVQGEEMIRNWAKADVLESVIRDQEAFQEAQIYRARALTEESRLRRETTKREVSGHIHPMKL